MVGKGTRPKAVRRITLYYTCFWKPLPHKSKPAERMSLLVLEYAS